MSLRTINYRFVKSISSKKIFFLYYFLIITLYAPKLNTFWFNNYPQKYSVNLIWINQEYDQSQVNILNPEQFANLLGWAKKNPTAQIKLWLDSRLTCKPALINLKKLITQKNSTKNILIKDIRKLKTVQKHPEVFAAQIPIFFRVDLLKIIIAVHAINQNHYLYFVYTDLDLTPIGKRKLFDRQTLKLIQKNSFVLARSNNYLGFENGFQIFKYQNRLAQALETCLIIPSIKLAHEFIANAPKSANLLASKAWKAQRAYFQEAVFRAYPTMISYFYKLADPDNNPNKTPRIVPVKKIKMPASTSRQFELNF